MRILFAAAEFTPLARVGGLGEASAGLVHALRDQGEGVDVVVPDYFGTPLDGETKTRLVVPSWAAPAVARSGVAPGVGMITLIDVPRIARDHPYTDADGQGWPDNADRFFAFSAAVAALASERSPDVLHCNDWHTAAVLGFVPAEVPSVLTIHSLGYQGSTSGDWLGRIPRSAASFDVHGGTNPLAGGIALADRVIAVSPTYAEEIRRPETGCGLDQELRALGERLVGIRNGIDTSVWNPTNDSKIAMRYGPGDIAGKAACRADLLDAVGWEDIGVPTVGMVTRLVEQKGIESALGAVPHAETMPFRLVLLGSGDMSIADHARDVARTHPDVFSFHEGYDDGLGHRIFAGSDLLLMPSRFEPCGLAQMQAMEYGTIPVVTAVGGLRDTVIDADSEPTSGSGFVAASPDTAGVVDALRRAVRAWEDIERRHGIQGRGMDADWSWAEPASQHLAVYRSVTDLSRN